MATVFERTVEKKVIFSLAEKADLGEIVIKEFLHAGYQRSQTAIYQSVEPEGSFRVINYPPSFTDKIDQCIDDFQYRKLNPPVQPEKVTKSVTVRQRKRTPVKRGPEKILSVKPENPNL